MLRYQKRSCSVNLPNLYGILMMRGDLDVLEEVLKCNSSFFQAIFVLDGTDDWRASERILNKFQNIQGIFRDKDLPKVYQRPPRDGARQVLLEDIQNKYGYDGYIVILHSDEMFFDYPPTLLAQVMAIRNIEAISVKNVHFFLHVSMKDSYTYNPEISVVDQVRYACFPGFPEDRIFKNKPGLYYEIQRHGRVIPCGLANLVRTNFPIRHYLYRYPNQMRNNAADRSGRNWQNYGSDWMSHQTDLFVDCLPGYAFSKYVPPGSRILNGETGELKPNV